MGRWQPAPMTRLKELLLLPENRPNKAFAERVGIDNALISRYALGRKPIPVRHLEMLCEELGVSPAELLGPPSMYNAV